MVVYARYASNNDDIWMWLEILKGNPITDGYRPNIGRFYPLAFADLNILMQFFSSPYVFFGINALIVFCIGILFWYMLDSVLGANQYMWLRILLLIGVLLHPGFVTIMLSICCPERLQVLFLLIFVAASFRFHIASKPHKTQYVAMIVGIIAANLALYLKEPTFLFIGLFGFVNLIAALKDKHKNTAAIFYYATLLASVAVFLALYMWLIYPNIIKAYGNLIFIDKVLHTIRGFINYSLNDCFIVWLLLALALYRAYMLCIKRQTAYLFFDALIFGGILYAIAFIVLGLFQNYYLVPIYAMSTSGALYFLFTLQYIKKIVFKLITAVCCVLFCINTLPMGIYTFTYFKTEGVKFHQSLAFISSQAKQNPHITLYFDGNGRSRAYNTWYWSHFMRYLYEVYGVSNFDVKVKDSDYPNMPKPYIDTSSPFSVYNNEEISIPQQGDFIILNNATFHYVDSAYLANMAEQYDVVYRTQAFGIPCIALKPIIKYIFTDISLLQQVANNNNNIFKAPYFDYIYQVR